MDRGDQVKVPFHSLYAVKRTSTKAPTVSQFPRTVYVLGRTDCERGLCQPVHPGMVHSPFLAPLCTPRHAGNLISKANLSLELVIIPAAVRPSRVGHGAGKHQTKRQ